MADTYKVYRNDAHVELHKKYWKSYIISEYTHYVKQIPIKNVTKSLEI